MTQAAQAVVDADREMLRLDADRTALADLVAEARGVLRFVKQRQRRQIDLRDELRQQLAAARLFADHTEKLAAEANVRQAIKALVGLAARLVIPNRSPNSAA